MEAIKESSEIANRVTNEVPEKKKKATLHEILDTVEKALKYSDDFPTNKCSEIIENAKK